ncbi:IclR family transcriptional regulator [Arthrobacter sp. AK01]|uniref:IclR family transcriptional regulator n=1 Tax=Micrococcaceae TaxID=1268 RepID=UPI001E5B0365|nr:MULTISPECIES: IclR family transcriptional regulator [Micrococcaceae]MCD4853130.1 IclR family transcriptional regulator [Arthrobacter sp. AK01]MCP1413696.1 IclR family acetate operon transcriptional repressor [Paenarthrobacter sp. A20]
MNSAPRISSTVSTALRILRLLSTRPGGFRLSDVAEACKIGKSSAHVLLSTLVEQGFVQKLSSGNYGLGITAFEVGSAVPENVRFGGAIARPMRELADTSGESVSLALLHGRHAVMVQRFESRQILRAEIRIGTRMPLFACASGKYFLAHMPMDEVNSLYPDKELPQGVSSGQLRTKAALIGQFEEIRSRNYASNVGEYADGINGVATGVRNASGELVAALSIAGPSSRFDIDSWTEPLLSTAHSMSLIHGKRGQGV